MIFSFLLLIFHALQWIFLNFSTFFQFSLAYISRPKVYFIFRDFQFFRLYSRSFSAFYFSRFLVISLFFSSLADVSIFHDFQFFLLYSTSYSGYFKFSTLFSVFFSLIFHAPSVYFYFPWFSVFSLIFQVLQCAFLFFTLFSDFIIFRR